jgi:ADP-ribose pyrophosphatase YjhB (NUDIX family)
MTARHFTVTTYLFHEDKTLLIWHPKFLKWMPPGGHLEQDEMPTDGAKREVLEETGLEIAFFPDEHLWIKSPNAVSWERPHFCLLEKLPPFGDQPAHEHIDLVFLARPLSLIPNSEPAHPVRWFTLEEIEELHAKLELFEDCFDIIRYAKKLLMTKTVSKVFA